ncbi:TorF family putative porin [Altererythrobacter sp. CAU 1778]
MRKATLLGAGALICVTASPALAQDAMNESSGPPASDPVEDASGMDVSVSLSAATDYVFRGISQSAEDPAVFAAVSVNYGGFYAGAGTENVDFPGIDQEYDLWAGYVMQLGGGTALDLGIVRYGYIDSPVNIDTVEVKAALSSALGSTGVGVAGYWTPDYFGTDDDGFYAEINAAQPVSDKLRVSGALGHQWIGAGGDYLTWNLGASYAVLPGANVDVRYHDTETSAFGTLADSRIVGSFSVSF